MEELNISKLKKGRNLDRNHSRKSIKSDNLHDPLTPSTLRKIKTSSSRPSTAKSGSRVEHLKSVGEREPLVRLSHAQPSEVPDNVAVHFASFYQNQDQTLPHSVQEKPVGLNAETSRNFPKMEFTRQMVHRLESSAGTRQYGRQVSTVLENTVEAPGFDLKLPPVDNCPPFDVPDDYYYPLWYRDPNKIPQISRELFRGMKEKYRYKMTAKELGKLIREVERPSSVELESEVEFETETESEEDEAKCKDNDESHVLKKCSKPSKIISKSKSSTEEKNLGNSVVNINHRSIDNSSSERSSCCSQTSCEIATQDDEEESVDWETNAEEEEEEVTVKVVQNYRKNVIVNEF